MALKCDVAIVGGGIGGLTLAIGLRQASMSVHVFEQDADLREIGAGIAIGGNATRLLERLGVDLGPVANVPPAVEFRRWSDGELLWSHPIGEWYRREAGANLLMLHRATLQRQLAAAVAPGCIQLDRRLIELSDEISGVRLRFERGDDVVANLVVGVDGVNSVTRRHVCGDVRPAYSGEIGFRGVIPIEGSEGLPDPTSLNIWCGPGTHVVYYGLDRGQSVNLLAVYRPDRLPAWTAVSSRLPATTGQALAIFEGYGWDRRILDLVRNIEGDMNFWALVDLPRLPQWSRGRVVLMGDAAHAPLPHQGQGAGQAIEDAYALAALLGRGGLGSYCQTFQAFENLRRGRTRRVQVYSQVSGRAVKFAGAAARRRDAGWSSLPQRIEWIHAYRAEDALAQLTSGPFVESSRSRTTESEDVRHASWPRAATEIGHSPVGRHWSIWVRRLADRRGASHRRSWRWGADPDLQPPEV